MLRNLIKEASNDVYASEDKLKAMISKMSPDEVAFKDYVDNDTGEIMLSRGEKAKTSRIHPQNEIDWEAEQQEKQAKQDRDYDEIDKFWERDHRAETQALLDSAVKEFAKNWIDYGSDMPGVEPEDIASDAAEGFFHEYPEWKQWMKRLNLTREDIKSYVQDMTYEAMTGNSV